MSLWRYMAFKVVLFSYWLLNVFTSLLFGFSLFSGHSKERAEMNTHYERSAHVLKVKWKMRKFELEGPVLSKHFLLRYVKKGHISRLEYLKREIRTEKSDGFGIFQD